MKEGKEHNEFLGYKKVFLIHKRVLLLFIISYPYLDLTELLLMYPDQLHEKYLLKKLALQCRLNWCKILAKSLQVTAALSGYT